MTHNKNNLVQTMGLLLGLACFACTDSDGNDENAEDQEGTEGVICDAGDSETCQCDAGTQGSRECAEDGKLWLPCQCSVETPKSGCGAQNWPETGTYTMMIDETEREYKVELPENYSPDVPYRLIFAWHAMGGNIQRMEDSGYYGQRVRWAGTAIFVAGQGLKIANVAGWSNLDNRDVDFARKLVETMTSNYCIDKDRIFSIGMSYGGIMSNTVGCSLGDTFRAIAPMSGGGPSMLFGSSSCTGQVAAWLSHGTNDTNIPWVTFTDGQASRDHWVKANHCSEETADILPGPCVAYQGCDEGYPVRWCAFEGKHQIPPFAANGIWTFLSQF